MKVVNFRILLSQLTDSVKSPIWKISKANNDTFRIVYFTGCGWVQFSGSGITLYKNGGYRGGLDTPTRTQRFYSYSRFTQRRDCIAFIINYLGLEVR